MGLLPPRPHAAFVLFLMPAPYSRDKKTTQGGERRKDRKPRVNVKLWEWDHAAYSIRSVRDFELRIETKNDYVRVILMNKKIRKYRGFQFTMKIFKCGRILLFLLIRDVFELLGFELARIYCIINYSNSFSLPSLTRLNSKRCH